MKRQARQITGDVFWVGAIDWNLRDFHGFSTSRGATYNAFLINGEEPVLVDTVKAQFGTEMLERVADVVDPARFKHIIVNHIEPDHSGAFTQALDAMPNAKVYASEIAKIGLHQHYQFDREIQVVASGETLELGGNVIQFVETPMAHWPDSMVSYMPKEKILFSSDIFGQLLATNERLDTELTEQPWYDAALYYANIILPFNHVVLKLFEQFEQRGIEPDYVMPDHGVVWTEQIPEIFRRYRQWADGSCAEGVAVVYDSMWGSTELMADHLCEALDTHGCKVRKLHIRSTPMSRIVTEIMFSKAVLIGTPTINDGIFPPVGQLLIYLQGLRPGPGRKWAGFGSYGWGGGGVEYVERWLRENQCEVICPSVESQFRPDKVIEKQITEFSRRVATAISCPACTP